MSSEWPVVRLGDVCEILDSKRKPVTKSERVPGDIPYYGASGVQDYVADYLFDEPLVLLGEDGAKWRAGDVSAFMISGKSWVNNHAHVLRPMRELVLDEWLTHFLVSSDLSDFITGVTVPKLNQAKMREIEIPLPPIDEQKRIVSKLDEAMGYVDELNTTIQDSLKQVEEFSKSAVSEVIEEQIDKVGAVRMDDIFTIARGGSPRPIKKFLTESNDGVNWIKISDATRTGKYITDTAEKISRDGISRSRYVEAGDLLLSNSMSFGRPYILKTDGCIHDGWLVLSSKQGKVDTEFMYYLLGSQFVYRQFDNLAAGSTVRNLNKDLVAGVKVPMPTLEVQQELMNRFQEIENVTDSLTENLTSRLRDADSLRSSILSAAFAGDL